MRKSLLLHAIIVVIFLFSACAKVPEKIDIEELIGGMKAEKCGDGIKDEWEECDFEGTSSCSEYNSEWLGPYHCNSCKRDTTECMDIKGCDLSYCRERSHCIESNYDYAIICKCDEGHTGEECKDCIGGYHIDLDYTCIPNDVCTLAGCKNERMSCRISQGRAVCDCLYEFTGENCDQCTQSNYYFEDGECKSGSCYDNGIQCLEYERCDDSSGKKPSCVCKTETQDPKDCSKCLPGYAWEGSYYGEICINSKMVNCVSNPDKPENSEDISRSVTITYSDANGWSEPAYCEWECSNNYYPENDICSKILINTTDANNILTALINTSNDLMLFGANGYIYKLNGENIKQQEVLPVHSVRDIKILPDGNYYYIGNFKNGAEYYIFLRTPDGREIIKIPDNSAGKNSILTFTKGGRMFQGDIENTFPYSSKIHSGSISTASSITITDDIGNIYTVYSDGNIFSASPYGVARWNKSFDNRSFSLQIALSKEKRIYVPYKDNSNNTGFYIINTDNGTLEKNVFLGNSYDLPSLSIGNDFIVASSGSGAAHKLTKTGEFINSVQTYSGENFSPIILNNGNIYTAQGGIYSFNKDFGLLWKKGSGNKKIIHYGNIIFGLASSYTYLYNAPGTPQGDWPQYLHDSMQSGSLENIEFVDPPKAPELISPADNFVSDTDNITFSWKIDNTDPTVKYTLLLRDYSGYDRVVAGPETGLNSATISGLIISMPYEWKVVSQDESGSLNVSKPRKFEVKNQRELWRYETTQNINEIYPAVNSEGDVAFHSVGQTVFINKNGVFLNSKNYGTNITYNAVAEENAFFIQFGAGIIYKYTDDSSFESYSSKKTILNPPIVHNSGKKLILSYKTGSFNLNTIENDVITQFPDQIGTISDPISNKEGIIFAGNIIDLNGEIIQNSSMIPLIVQNGKLFYRNDGNYFIKDNFIDIWSLDEIGVPYKGSDTIVFHNDEFSSFSFNDGTCNLISGTMEDFNWRAIYSWNCLEIPKELVVGSDGTFFIVEVTEVFAVKEGEGELWRTGTGPEKAHGLTLTEEGELYVISGNRFISLQNESSGADPLEWSQFRANAQRTACEPSETYNLMPSLKLISPAKNTVILEDSFTFSWESNDPENESLTYDFDLGVMGNSKKEVIYSVVGLTEKFHEVIGHLPEKSTIYWKVTAKDASGTYNVKESVFTTSSFPPEPWQKIFPLPTNSPVQNREGVFYYSSDNQIHTINKLDENYNIKSLTDPSFMNAIISIGYSGHITSCYESVQSINSDNLSFLWDNDFNLENQCYSTAVSESGESVIIDSPSSFSYNCVLHFLNIDGTEKWNDSVFFTSKKYYDCGNIFISEKSTKKEIWHVNNNNDLANFRIFSNDGNLINEYSRCSLDKLCVVKNSGLNEKGELASIFYYSDTDETDFVIMNSSEVLFETTFEGEYTHLLIRNDSYILMGKNFLTVVKRSNMEMTSYPLLNQAIYGAFLLENNKILIAIRHSTIIVFSISNDLNSVLENYRTDIDGEITKMTVGYDGTWLFIHSYIHPSYASGFYYGDDPVDMSQPWPMQGHDPGNSNTIQIEE